jgi:acyl-CoA synthetase (AMP-forming)/AMP-acid ligase II
VPAPLRPAEVLSRYGAHAATLDAALDARVAAGPARAFLVEDGRETSYGAFAARVAAAAALLRDAGVGHGDRVAVVSATDAAMVTALFATCRLGAVFVPVNPDLRPPEAAQVVARSRPRLVLHGAAQGALAREASAGMEARLLDMAVAFAGLDDAPRLPAGHPRPGPGDTCLVLFTSGTTGVPKGVMHAHRSFVVAG